MIILEQSTPSWAPVYNSGLLTGLTSVTSPNVALVSWTAPIAGLYRLSGAIFPTTLNSGSWNVEIVAEFSENGQAGSNTLPIASCALGAGSATVNSVASVVVALAAGAVVKFCTVTLSGSANGGVFSVQAISEHLT